MTLTTIETICNLPFPDDGVRFTDRLSGFPLSCPKLHLMSLLVWVPMVCSSRQRKYLVSCDKAVPRHSLIFTRSSYSPTPRSPHLWRQAVLTHRMATTAVTGEVVTKTPYTRYTPPKYRHTCTAVGRPFPRRGCTSIWAEAVRVLRTLTFCVGCPVIWRSASSGRGCTSIRDMYL